MQKKNSEKALYYLNFYLEKQISWEPIIALSLEFGFLDSDSPSMSEINPGPLGKREL